MEKKTAESGFAVPLSLEHAVPMEELNAQLRCVRARVVALFHFSAWVLVCLLGHAHL